MSTRRRAGKHAATQAINTRYDDATASPGFVLWQVASLWQRSLRSALDAAELTHAQFVLLASAGWLESRTANGDGATVTQSDIAEHAKTDAVMTSEVLRTLERKGLVKRLAHPTDARAKQIALTAAGRRTAQRAVALVEEADEAFFGARGAELEQLARLLCPMFAKESRTGGARSGR
jgi:DNA-binding MarR family transcriptional regulator